MRWTDKLTGEQVKHLREQKIRSIAGLKRTRVVQQEQRAKDGREPCYDCRAIAVALGLEEKRIEPAHSPGVFGTWVFRLKPGAGAPDLETVKGFPSDDMVFITMRAGGPTPDTEREFAWAKEQGLKGDYVMVCNGPGIVLLEVIA